jgi:outer membrane protein TolC
VWNVGLTVHVPVWNWMESSYKIRASKNATLISEMELSDANEKINLQISQCRFKLNEAKKRLKMATDNLTSADEAEDNLSFAQRVGRFIKNLIITVVIILAILIIIGILS